VYYTSLPSANTWASFVRCVEIFNQHKGLAHAKGGGTTGARGALAPLKFAKGGLSPPWLWTYNTDYLLK